MLQVIYRSVNDVSHSVSSAKKNRKEKERKKIEKKKDLLAEKVVTPPPPQTSNLLIPMKTPSEFQCSANHRFSYGNAAH